jgi:hypothetical protein
MLVDVDVDAVVAGVEGEVGCGRRRIGIVWR